jgi:carbon-monoxide dehydrogenase iron sulfur subunit
VKRIVADPKRCLACRSCELACALAHAKTDDLVQALFAQGVQPRIYIEAAGALAVPLQCRHCEDAPCVRVCPTAALGRAEHEAPVTIEAARCIGCGFCVEVCPFGVIRLTPPASADRDQVRVAAIKCDLCAPRAVEGLGPACVASCPVGALSFEEVDQCARRKARATAAQWAADGA